MSNHKIKATDVANKLLYAYEVGATMKDLDGTICMWRSIVEAALIEADRSARKDELAACVEIFSAEFKAYNWRGFKAASDRFSAAIGLIRARLEENEKSTTDRNHST